MKTKQKAGQEGIISVGNNIMSFKFEGKRVVLPIVDGYIPRSDDDIIMYKEERPDGQENTFYSFNLVDVDTEGNDMGGLKALYQISPEGDITITSNIYEDKKVVKTNTFVMNQQNVKNMNKYVDGGKINFKEIEGMGLTKIKCGKNNISSKDKVASHILKNVMVRSGR